MDYLAITMTADGLMNRIESEIEIFQEDKSKKLNGVWDTGSQISYIEESTAREMGLELTQDEDGAFFAEIDVQLLPSEAVVGEVHAYVASLDDDTDFLIGMDIITVGDLAITNVDEKTMFSFRVPSAGSIDFVEEANAE